MLYVLLIILQQRVDTVTQLPILLFYLVYSFVISTHRLYYAVISSFHKLIGTQGHRLVRTCESTDLEEHEMLAILEQLHAEQMFMFPHVAKTP